MPRIDMPSSLKREAPGLLPWRDIITDELKRPITQAKLMLELRARRQERPREDIWMRSETLALSPTFSVEFSMAFISIQGAADCYNKSTAVYNLQGFHFPLLFLHNFLFDAWHKLYENDIEYREFIAKVIVQMSLSNPTRATNLQPALEDRVSDPKVVADALLTTAEIHRYLATEVENVLARAESIMDHPLDQNPERAGSDGLLYRSAPRFYHLHPLFRALVIVAAEYSFEEHRTRYRDDFWQQPVYLLRTVHTKGLSAPIDFAPLALDLSERFLS